MRLRILVALVGIIAISTASAGVVYQIESTTKGSGEPRVETITAKVDGDNLKMSMGSAGGGVSDDMIFRGGVPEMIMVSHKEKKFYVIDDGVIEQIGGQMSDIERQIQEALKDVPPDQRALVEQMMKSRMPKGAQATSAPSFTINKTSDRDTKNGYPCVRYELILNGTKIQDMWVTEFENVEGGAEVRDAFLGMSEFFQSLRDAMPQFARGGDENMFQHMKEMDGFPVVTFDYGPDGSVQGESKLVSASRQSVSADEYNPPANYVKQDMMSLGR